MITSRKLIKPRTASETVQVREKDAEESRLGMYN